MANHLVKISKDSTDTSRVSDLDFSINESRVEMIEENRDAIDAIKDILTGSGIVPTRRVARIAEEMVLEKFLSIKRIGILFKRDELRGKLIQLNVIDEEEVDMVLEYFKRSPTCTVSELQQQLEETKQKYSEETNTLRSTITQLQQILQDCQADIVFDNDRVTKAVADCKKQFEEELQTAKQTVAILTVSANEMKKTIADHQYEEQQLNNELAYLRQQNNLLQSNIAELTNSNSKLEDEIVIQQNIFLQKEMETEQTISTIRSQTDVSVHEYESENSKLRNTVSEVLNQFADYKVKSNQENEQLKNVILQYKEDIVKYEERLGVLVIEENSKRHLLTTEIDRLKCENSELHQQNVTALNELEAMKTELTTVCKDNERLLAALEELKTNLSEKNQIFESETFQLQKQITSLNEELLRSKEEATYEANAFRVTVVGLQKQLVDSSLVDNMRTTATNQEHGNRVQVIALQTELEQFQKEFDAKVESKLAEQKVIYDIELNRLHHTITSLEAALADDHRSAETAIQDWSNVVQELQQQIHSFKVRIHEKDHLIQNLHIENNTLIESLTAANDSIDIVRRQLTAVTESAGMAEKSAVANEARLNFIIQELKSQIDALNLKLVTSMHAKLLSTPPRAPPSVIDSSSNIISAEDIVLINYNSPSKKFNTPSPTRRIVSRKSPLKLPTPPRMPLPLMPPVASADSSALAGKYSTPKPAPIAPTSLATGTAAAKLSPVSSSLSLSPSSAATVTPTSATPSPSSAAEVKQRLYSRLSSKISQKQGSPLSSVVTGAAVDKQQNITRPEEIEKLYLRTQSRDEDAMEALFTLAKEGNNLAASFCMFVSYADEDGNWKTDEKKALLFYNQVKDWLYKTSIDDTNELCKYAQLNLGKCFALGIGETQNLAEAAKLFLLSAEAGFPTAQYNLGVCYEQGIGIKRSIKEAMKWYETAASNGDKDAQYIMGSFYAEGSHVKKNEAKAIQYFRQAADQGQSEAETALGLYYSSGIYNEASNEVILQPDAREAARLYRSAAEKGYAPAQHYLGVCMENGLGLVKDQGQACRMYRLAAAQGNADAQHSLGSCYHYGSGVYKNITEAISWYRRAAAQRHPDAQYSLACCYADGDGVEQNDAEAFQWYKLAAENRQPDAMYNLGVCYANGTGIDRNEAEAVKWLSLAADAGIAFAQYNLSIRYQNGIGVPQDSELAKMWLKLANDQGYDGETLDY